MRSPALTVKICPRSDDEQHLPSLPIPPSSSTRLCRETRRIVNPRSMNYQPATTSNQPCSTHSTHHPFYCSIGFTFYPTVINLPIIQAIRFDLFLPDTRSTHHPLFTTVHDSPPILIHTDHFLYYRLHDVSHQLIYQQTKSTHPTAL